MDTGRFLDCVEHEPNTGCWLWSMGMSGEGYGILRNESAEVEKAHRFSYRTFVGDIPNGRLICHHCDTKLCVNPDHLYAGTPQDNVRDMVRRGRQHDQRRTHCLKGHELSAGNTYEYFDQRRGLIRRSCRTCMKMCSARYRQKLNAA